MRMKPVALVCLTSLAFLVIQGTRLLTDGGWSWIITVAYGMAIIWQVFSYWGVRGPNR
jgi:hypothetical protein